MPRPRSDEDLGALGLSPEQALVAAMLRAAVSDARNQAHGRYDALRRTSARAWLKDREAVMFWLELVGLPDWTYSALLKEAGLESH